VTFKEVTALENKAPINVGRNIKLVCDSKGVSLTFVARKMGKTSGWLSNIARGHRSIDSVDLYGIAQILGVDINIFFADDLNATFNPTGTDD
jgi:transcriptional regulator with XRE-family HTH domain